MREDVSKLRAPARKQERAAAETPSWKMLMIETILDQATGLEGH